MHSLLQGTLSQDLGGEWNSGVVKYLGSEAKWPGFKA